MKKLLLSVGGISTSMFAKAQGIKIKSLSELEKGAQDAGNTITNMAMNALAVVLGLALIFVIYAVSSNNPKAKEYAIAWIIALVIYLLARFTIFA